MTPRFRTAFLFLGPWIVGALFFFLLPFFTAFFLSMTGNGTRDQINELQFVGGENYRQLLAVDASKPDTDRAPWHVDALNGRLKDKRFFNSIKNSFFYSLVAVPTGLLVSLGLATLLNRSFRGATIVRSLFYLPSVLGGVATIVIWSWLFNPQFGWINEIIRGAYAIIDPVVQFATGTSSRSWPTPDWLYSPLWCLPALVIMHCWTCGASMLVFLAALRRIPLELLDAARIDGATRRQRFVHVVLPQIAPVVLFNAAVMWGFTMQSFSEPYLLQNRQQDDELLFVSLHIYRTAFESPYRVGYASAMACVLFVVLMVTTLPMWWLGRKWGSGESQER